MRRSVGILVAGLGLVVAHGLNAVAEPCRATPGVAATVRAVPDGRTLTLADGRIVLLAGLAPLPPGLAEAASAALRGLVGDGSITVAQVGEPDRHGRTVAMVFRDGVPLQKTLLAEGFARLGGAQIACDAPLREAERTARLAGQGLWADPAFAPFDAADTARLLEARGQFVLVRGRVLSVRESGATIYVNFGRRWSEDFTATLAKRSEKEFTAAGVPLRTLAGSDMLLRGVIEVRGGPWIDLVRPGQVDWADRR